MKRFTAIGLLALLFFTAGGYFSVFFLLWTRSGSRLEARLDRGNYPTKPSLVLRIPLLLPYGVDGKSYQRVDGELCYQGQHYNAYQRRIWKDTLYTCYVQDPYINRLHIGFNEAIQLLTGVPLSGNNPHQIWDNLFREYLSDAAQALPETPDFQSHLQFRPPGTDLADPGSEPATPPPDLSCLI